MRLMLGIGSSTVATFAALLVAASPAFAQTPAGDPPPALPPAPAASPAPAPSPAQPMPATLPPSIDASTDASSGAPRADTDRPADGAATDGDTRRGEGLRLGLDLGFQRAFSGANDRLNAGSPTILPLGADLSVRTSPSILLGLHGYAALASRDDCVEVDSCRARAYGVGAHIETPLSRGTSFVPWLRYGMTYEILYQGGAPLDAAGHTSRGAFDFLNLRVGGDFIVARGKEGKTMRIGAFLGFVGGILVTQTGVSNSSGRSVDLDRDSGSAHIWFSMGVRATLDP